MRALDDISDTLERGDLDDNAGQILHDARCLLGEVKRLRADLDAIPEDVRRHWLNSAIDVLPGAGVAAGGNGYGGGTRW